MQLGDKSSSGTIGETVGPEIVPIGASEVVGERGTSEHKGFSGGGRGGGGGGGWGDEPATEDAWYRAFKILVHTGTEDSLRRQLEREFGPDFYARTDTPPPPPGMGSIDVYRFGNWTGRGYSARRTSPSFLPLTPEDMRVEPKRNADGTLNLLDNVSKSHDPSYNEAQQKLLKDLLDPTKTAQQALGDYHSALSKADRKFLADITSGKPDLGKLSGDPWENEVLLRARELFPVNALRSEHAAASSYRVRNAFLESVPPALADAQLKYLWFSQLVHGQVVGRPVEAVLNKLRNRVIELGGDPDFPLWHGQPAAYVDNPNGDNKNDPSVYDAEVTYGRLSGGD